MEPHLALIHIPRTGGTSIEECTVDEAYTKFTWGNRHAPFHVRQKMDGNIVCWGQHVPPDMFPFYDGKETFCVVRDPHERLISEFGFNQEFYEQNQHCDIDSMNRDLLNWLSDVKGIPSPNSMARSKPSPYSRDCHMLPQSAFVYGWDPEVNVVDRQRKRCKHLLRFERLADDFNAFMQARGYPYRLSDHKRSNSTKKSMRSNKACSALKRNNLTADVKALLYDVYKDDFELFGYSMN